jgi:hypothetical protein
LFFCRKISRHLLHVRYKKIYCFPVGARISKNENKLLSKVPFLKEKKTQVRDSRASQFFPPIQGTFYANFTVTWILSQYTISVSDLLFQGNPRLLEIHSIELLININHNDMVRIP